MERKFIIIKFYNNWYNSIYPINKKEKSILSNGIKMEYDKSTTIKDMFLFLNKQFLQLNYIQNEINFLKVNEENNLRYLYRLVCNKEIIYFFDLRMKIHKLIKILRTIEISILLSIFVGKGGNILYLSGMRFFFHSKEEGKHNVPHIHVAYNGKEASISLDGNVLAGYLPTKKLKCAKQVIKENKESLLLKWNDLTDGQKFELKNNQLNRIF